MNPHVQSRGCLHGFKADPSARANDQEVSPRRQCSGSISAHRRGRRRQLHRKMQYLEPVALGDPASIAHVRTLKVLGLNFEGIKPMGRPTLWSRDE
jgi:hypothetical protein